MRNEGGALYIYYIHRYSLGRFRRASLLCGLLVLQRTGARGGLQVTPRLSLRSKVSTVIPLETARAFKLLSIFIHTEVGRYERGDNEGSI